MNTFWAVLNIECEIVREAKPGKYPQKQRNIATTKLIQCGIEKMLENKAFQGIGKMGYWILVSIAVKWNQSCLALCTSF